MSGKTLADMDKVLQMGSMDAHDFLTRPRVQRWRRALKVAMRFAVEGYTTQVNDMTCCRYCLADHRERRDPPYSDKAKDKSFVWLDVTQHEPTCEYALWLSQTPAKGETK